MSKENVKLFYEILSKDKSLQEKTTAIGKKYAGQKLDETQMEVIYQKELIPLAKKEGYDFTLTEIQDYASETKKPAMREISEEELATVAGGEYCMCVIQGIGNYHAGMGASCACTLGGFGDLDYYGKVDCVCVLGGGGG